MTTIFKLSWVPISFKISGPDEFVDRIKGLSYEEIANKNEGKNSSQVQNIRFNQAQSYKSNIEIQKFSKKMLKK